MKKKQQLPITYLSNETQASSLVEEPFMPFYSDGVVIGNTSGNPLSKTLSMIGIANTKQYSFVTNEGDFITIIREGLPKIAMDTMVSYTGIPSVEMAEIMRISERTLRRYTNETILNPEQSERLIELARLYTKGEDVFGSLLQFNQWMNSEVVALGQKKPKAFLDTSFGIQMLMDELGKIEHGIFA